MGKNNKKLSALHPIVLVILVLGSIAFVLSILYIESENSSKTEYKSLENIGKAYSNSIIVYRDFYSNIILKNIHDSNVKITHDYKSKENAIPIPATMTLDLISFLNSKDTEISLRLISKYPYPWRGTRTYSSFDEESMKYFNTTSRNSYSKLYEKNGKSYFEYAVPIKMKESCVNCHNSHPNSPKKDWKIGDVRGVQIVSLYPDVITTHKISDRIYLIITILIFFTFNLSVIFWLLKKDKKSYSMIIEEKEKLKDALKDAEDANSAKSQFLANMSHEIRTPLNAIIGFSEILSQSKLEKNEKEQAKIVYKSGVSLLGIINDILDFSKIESGQFELLNETNNLKKIAKDVIILFDIKAKEKDIKLVYKEDKSIPNNLIFDEIKLRQVLLNLISNAIKFTPKGGEVTLIINKKEIKSKNVIIYFEVKDSGIGIPKEKQNLIFEAFTQADGGVSKEYGGTGLGLTIVSKIINLMGSKVQIKSELNKGSSFYFDLDFIISDEIKKESKKEYNNIQFPQNNFKILVAEDNPINVMLVEELLSQLSLKAHYASNGDEALQKFKEENFDIVFMDINMPICDGITATKNIREYEKLNNKKSTPIIALTASVMMGDREKFLDSGMNEHLGKPIDFIELQNTLAKYLNN